ncbi:VOC family protein [Neobacillus sp. D3-1R]|uniref:VOC family protein n=1 Tax=Neobacillus sp. D3-1R TaxID=3445778 RepID=UPI003FA0E9C7
MSLFSKMDTIILRVADIKAAKKWYEEVLEFTSSYESNGDHAIVIFPIGNGPSITLYEWQHDESHSPASSSYPIFFAENIEEVHTKLTSRGVETSELQKDGSTTFFTFYDLNGNKLEVCYWS